MGESNKSRGKSAFKLPLPPPSEDDRLSRLRVSKDLPMRPDPLAEPLGVEASRDSRTEKVDVASLLEGGQEAEPVEGATRLTSPGTARRRLEQTRDPLPLEPDRDSSPPLPGGPNSSFAIEGQLIGGRYRVVSPLGEGGMGKVFKVAHAQLGKTFALKLIHNRVAGEDQARDLFYREARLASQMSHPNITTVVDFGEDDQVGAYMVMEYLEGEQLSATLGREKTFSLKQACDVVLQVAEALNYIHSKDIIHCDIKTENILMVRDEGSKRRKQTVKLLDFGLARRAAERPGDRLSGTPQYVAPERIEGAKALPASDIYGLGILFYELLCGAPPFDGSVEQILEGHLSKEPERPSDVRGEEVDPALEQLIMRSLAKSPDDRHRDMNAFVYELRTVMHMLGFGGRQRKGGTRVVEKVVRDRGTRRDELARKAFDMTRLPMALIAHDGTIAVANAAFCKFVMGTPSQVEGLTVQSTPLAQVWQTLDTDLSRALRGRAVRRVIEVAREEGVLALVMRIEPGPDQSALFTVYPLQE